MPGKMSLFLIASLAVNAALLGVVGGRVLGGNKKEPSVQMQLERYGPTSDVVAAAWEQLPDADRKILREQFRERWKSLEIDRKQLSEAGKTVFEAAKAEPFDEVKLRDAVTIFQTREQRMQQSAEDILISHLGKMPAEARATAAVGLLTPFNARMQRVDVRRGEGGPHGPGRDGKGPKEPGLVTPTDIRPPSQEPSPAPSPARPN